METVTETLSTLTPYLPVVLLVLIAHVVIREFREARRPTAPEDGCCGCGADLGDALVGGENYCWSCIDTWPDTAVAPVAELGITVFPGRERGVR